MSNCVHQRAPQKARRTLSRTVILSPHHDDVALFTAFNAIRYQAHIVVVLRSVKQEQYGITDDTRRREEMQAAAELGCTVEFWDYPDVDPDWDVIGERILGIEADLVLTPMLESEEGNEQHNMVYWLTSENARWPRLQTYLTYTKHGKSTWGRLVEFEPAWVPQKLRALACHMSQASLPNCMEHFLRDQHEYVA